MKGSILALVILISAESVPALSQVTPDMAQGLSPYAMYVPSGIDNVNPVNGNVFLNIPLLSYPQRGGKLRLDYYVFYNDKQWQLPAMPTNSPSGTTWTGRWNLGDPSSQTGFSMTVGAYVARDQYAQFGTDTDSGSYTYGGASYEQFTVQSYLYSYYFLSSDGGKHYVGDAFYQTCSQTGSGVCPSGFPYEVYEHYPATDGTGIDQYGHDSDGIQYVAQTGNVPFNVVDPNGNAINATSSGLTDTFNRNIPGTLTGPGALPFPNSSRNPTTGLGGYDLIPGVPAGSVPAQCPSGTSSARIWTVPGSSSYGSGSVTYYLCYTLYSYQTAFNANSILPPASNTTYSFTEATSTGTGSDGQALMLTAVILPNSRSYTFAYDQYLSLIQLGLPSGATISYTWQNIMFNPKLYGSAPISRALKTRTINPGGGQPSSTTTYHWNITYGSDGSVQYPAYSIITDANGNDEEHTLGGTDDGGKSWSDYIDLGSASYSGCSPHDTATDKVCSPTGGTLMKAETYALTAYASGGAAYGTPSYVVNGPTLATEVTTHVPSSGGELVSKTIKTLVPNFGTCSVYTYPLNMYSMNGSESGIQNNGGGSAPMPTSQQVSNCYSTGQVASVASYDFGTAGSGAAGPLIKTESTTYTWQPPYFSSVPALSTIQSANLLNLVNTSVTTDGSGGWAAESDFCYDGHGNQTAVEKFPTQPSSHSCSPAPANAATTSSVYNSQGVVTSTTDANSNTSQITSLACNGSLPQNITMPDGNNVLYGYDCNTGKVTSVQDQNDITNGKQTQYTYADSLARVTSASFPDGGNVQVDYHGDPSPLTVTVTRATGEAAGANVVTKTYDGLTREISSQTSDSLSSSVSDTVSTFTNYDAAGHVQSASNPYRSSQDSTYGVTQYNYDALGRHTKLSHPDNSSQSWSYDGATTTFTDESGNQWQRTSDALGRLKQALEPNGVSQTASMPTTYNYDVLGNLRSVNQTGVSGTDTSRATRSFFYDGLSRLVAANNPENARNDSGPQLSCQGASGTWSMCYSYDGNGNVIKRTDNRNISITYGYDQMNRLLSKAYSSGDPSACRQYNTAPSGASDSNPKGNLTMEWMQSGSCPQAVQSSVPSAALSSRIILKHDAMNRVLSEQQCPLTPCSAAYVFTYSYDLAGNVISSNNGMPTSTSSTIAPAISWGATYDAANRLSLISVNSQPWSDSAHPPVLFEANQNTYSTFGNVMPYDSLGNLVHEQLGLTTSGGPSNAGVMMQASYDSRGRMQSESFTGESTATTSATGSSGNVAISGNEKSTTTASVAATANIGISGSEQSTTIYTCPMQYGGCPTTIYDGGGYSIYVNGISAGGFGWSQGSTSSGLATSLASSINGNSSSPVTASASGSSVILTSKVTGPAGNYSISVTRSWSSSYFSSPSFTVSAPSSMSGGASGSAVYDSGSISVTVNSKTASVNWGNGSSTTSIASALASAINTADNSFLSASASGTVVSLTSNGTGGATNWPIQISSTYDTAHFSSASFSGSASGMSGGTDASGSYATIYAFTLPSPASGYSPNGNLLTYSDSLTGTWNSTSNPIGYDTLNRLTQMNAISGPYHGQYGCWGYDSFGNRKLESFQTTPCSSSYSPNVTYNASNQVAWASATGSPFSYDLAGDVTGDALNSYVYDAEGRLCAMRNYNGSIYQYIYDVEGHRVAKGTVSSLSCPAPTSGSGFTVLSLYLLGLSGDQVTEMSANGAWQHTNALAGGIIATYSTASPAFSFHISDPLGSRRVLADATGNVLQQCINLPYGNGETCTTAPTEHLFVAKERDLETGSANGNDYFPSRYYSSRTGQFLSPDPSGLSYADPSDPQSLNLYAYVRNNPLMLTDPTGLHWEYKCDHVTAYLEGRKEDWGYNSCRWVNVDDGPPNGSGIDIPAMLNAYAHPAEDFRFVGYVGPYNGCSSGLAAARKTRGGVARANAAWNVLDSAANAHGIDTSLLAAIGVRETDFRNVQEVLKGGKPGPGMGVFQLTNQRGVSAEKAYNLPFAADYAANMLSSNMKYLAASFSLNPDQLQQATAASYNLGKFGISGNPMTIDKGSAGNNYGSSVVDLMDCFPHP